MARMLLRGGRNLLLGHVDRHARDGNLEPLGGDRCMDSPCATPARRCCVPTATSGASQCFDTLVESVFV